MMIYLRNLDNAILALPVATAAAVVTGCSFLEQNDISIVHGTGWLLGRTFVVLGMALSLPLLIWQVVKEILHTFVYWITNGTYQFASETDFGFRTYYIILPIGFMIALHMAQIIESASNLNEFYIEVEKRFEQAWQEAEGVYNEF